MASDLLSKSLRKKHEVVLVDRKTRCEGRPMDVTPPEIGNVRKEKEACILIPDSVRPLWPRTTSTLNRIL
ncbi:MAG: hypothetical protein ACE5I5_13960 [Candidatus Heimdallarchaeota archaeon]